MRSFRLDLEYHGKDFAGWQIQPNAPTIEGTLHKALAELWRETVVYDLLGGGRTDAGVHALQQTAHLQGDIPPRWTARSLQKALNGLLPPSISIWHCQEVDNGWHARYSARARYYRYRLYPSRRRRPLSEGLAWWVKGELQFKPMEKAAGYLVGSHNFSGFQNLGSPDLNPHRTVYLSALRKVGEEWWYDICANAFLRGMVRTIVGTLVDIGRGKAEPQLIQEILARCERNLAGATAPPEGLTLMRIFYPDDPPEVIARAKHWHLLLSSI